MQENSILWQHHWQHHHHHHHLATSSSSGLEPDPSKLDTINKMTAPKDVKELQTFLGLATYLQRFTPRLSKLAAPIPDLCKKDTIFSWEKGQQEALENLKRELLSPKVLQ